jgi:hypothetical protein
MDSGVVIVWGMGYSYKCALTMVQCDAMRCELGEYKSTSPDSAGSADCPGLREYVKKSLDS